MLPAPVGREGIESALFLSAAVESTHLSTLPRLGWISEAIQQPVVAGCRDRELCFCRVLGVISQHNSALTSTFIGGTGGI